MNVQLQLQLQLMTTGGLNCCWNYFFLYLRFQWNMGLLKQPIKWPSWQVWECLHQSEISSVSVVPSRSMAYIYGIEWEPQDYSFKSVSGKPSYEAMKPTYIVHIGLNDTTVWTSWVRVILKHNVSGWGCPFMSVFGREASNCTSST